MKRISLKPVVFQLPRDVSPQLQRSIAQVEAAIRENNQLLESTLNNINATIIVSGADATLDANNVLHIS